VKYISENQDNLLEQDIEVYLIGKEEDNYHYTQSMLFAINCIIEGKTLHEARIDDKYDNDMKSYLYNLIMPNQNEDFKPTENDKKLAENWRYLKF
jgi:hypothetical protein